jgi:hypothetical protein
MVDIGDLRINELSGPVSFHYYFPEEEAFHENAEKGVFLPIVILLGDGQRDEEKDCFVVEGNAFLGATTCSRAE